VTAKAIGSDKIRIEWEPNTEEDVVAYIIQRSPSPDGPWAAVDTVLKEKTTLTDSGLDADTTYYYRVIALDVDSRESPPSVVARASTAAPEAFPGILLWILLIIVVLTILVVLFFALFKRRKREE
jgi:phosphodiesterase/alkaline phosphatase D-like protein